MHPLIVANCSGEEISGKPILLEHQDEDRLVSPASELPPLVVASSEVLNGVLSL